MILFLEGKRVEEKRADNEKNQSVVGLVRLRGAGAE